MRDDRVRVLVDRNRGEEHAIFDRSRRVLDPLSEGVCGPLYLGSFLRECGNRLGAADLDPERRELDRKANARARRDRLRVLRAGRTAFGGAVGGAAGVWVLSPGLVARRCRHGRDHDRLGEHELIRAVRVLERDAVVVHVDGHDQRSTLAGVGVDAVDLAEPVDAEGPHANVTLRVGDVDDVLAPIGVHVSHLHGAVGRAEAPAAIARFPDDLAVRNRIGFGPRRRIDEVFEDELVRLDLIDAVPIDVERVHMQVVEAERLARLGKPLPLRIELRRSHLDEVSLGVVEHGDQVPPALDGSGRAGDVRQAAQHELVERIFVEVAE